MAVSGWGPGGRGHTSGASTSLVGGGAGFIVLVGELFVFCRCVHQGRGDGGG